MYKICGLWWYIFIGEILFVIDDICHVWYFTNDMFTILCMLYDIWSMIELNVYAICNMLYFTEYSIYIYIHMICILYTILCTLMIFLCSHQQVVWSTSSPPQRWMPRANPYSGSLIEWVIINSSFAAVFGEVTRMTRTWEVYQVQWHDILPTEGFSLRFKTVRCLSHHLSRLWAQVQRVDLPFRFPWLCGEAHQCLWVVATLFGLRRPRLSSGSR